MSFIECLILACLLRLAAALGQQQIITFENSPGKLLLGSRSSRAQIIVDASEWAGVIRAANDLVADFGRVTGTNGTVTTWQNSTPSNFSGITCVIVGTLGQSDLINSLVSTNVFDASAIDGQWEAFQSQVIQNPISGVSSALVIAGSYV